MLVEEAGAGVLAEWGGEAVAGQQKKMQVRQRRVVGEADMGRTVRGTSGGRAMHTKLGKKK